MALIPVGFSAVFDDVMSKYLIDMLFFFALESEARFLFKSLGPFGLEVISLVDETGISTIGVNDDLTFDGFTRKALVDHCYHFIALEVDEKFLLGFWAGMLI